MRYKLKSRQLRQIEKIIKAGSWHKSFALIPRAVDSAKGYTVYAWMRPIMRRKVRRINSEEVSVRSTEYTEAENITMQTLAEGTVDVNQLRRIVKILQPDDSIIEVVFNCNDSRDNFVRRCRDLDFETSHETVSENRYTSTDIPIVKINEQLIKQSKQQ